MRITLTGPFDTNVFRKASGLSLAGAPVGQGGTPIANIAARLLRDGHSVSVATLAEDIDEPKRFQEGGCRIVYCPLRAGPRFRARVRSRDLFEKEVRHLKDAIVELGPDIVHAHWTYEYAEATVRSRLPHLVTMRDLGWDYFWQLRDGYRLMRLIMKYRTMPRVKNLSVIAPFMAKKAWVYGYFGPTSIIPNGTQVPTLTRPAEERDFDNPRIVTIGNRGRIKNVRKSIEAFRRIRQTFQGAELHLFGPGLDPEFVDGEPSVIGHGAVPHAALMEFLAREATLLVHPARIETFGMIIAEAKARQVPVVAGMSSGGVSYVCDDGVSRLVDVEDARAIAEAALSMLADRENYLYAATSSREDIRRRFSVASVTEQYLALYKDILSRDGRVEN